MSETETTKGELARRTRYDPWRLFKIGAIVLLAVATASTVIYYYLGQHYGRDWSVMDCLFMVVITLTTIGYGDWLDLRHLPLAEVYTMILAIVGIGVPAFIISNITAMIMEGFLGDTMRRRRMQQEIAKLGKHVIVCGAGGTGEHCIEELVKIGRRIVVIDCDEQRLKVLHEEHGQFPYIVGHADRDDVLAQAGITRAEGLICCLTEDKDNLFVALSARMLNPDLRIVSKATDDHARKKLLLAGASSVVSPTAIGGLRMVSELVRPTTTSFLDSMLRERSAVRFSELTVKGGSRLAGHTLAEADLRDAADVLLVAARHPGVENFIYNPKADFHLEANCVVVVLGPVSEVEKLRPIFEGK